jgi:hypothetical protein
LINDLHTFDVSTNEGNVRWYHGVKFLMPKVEYASEDMYFVIVRALCHVLIDRIPDKGIPDMYNCLKDSWDFYQLPPPPQKAIAEGPVIRRVFPTVDARPFQFVAED